MLKKLLLILSLSFSLFASLSEQTLFYGGNIITMEGDKPTYVEAVIIKDGKIIYAGSKQNAFNNYAGKTVGIDLKGKTMLPGFIEPHLHPSIAAILLGGDIVAPHDWKVPEGLKKGVQGHDAYIERLKASIKKYGKKNSVLFIWGYHPLWHGTLSRAELNTIAPNIPVGVIHRSFHEIYLNDAAIKFMHIKKDDYEGNAQVEWEKGHFYEGGWLTLVPHIAPYLLEPKRYKKGLHDMSLLIRQNGITTVAEQGFPESNFKMEYALLKNEMRSNPPYDIYNVLNGTQLVQIYGSDEKAYEWMESASQYDTKHIFMLPKEVKLYADGAIYSLAMQMEDGYSDGFKGQWMTPPKRLEEQMNFYWDKGYKIHIHANGDKGIQLCLDITKRMMKRHPRKNHGLTLHHVGYFTAKQADEMKELGIEVSANPYYVWALAEKYSQYGLGKARAEKLVPLKFLEDRKIPFSLHSDFAMAPAEPLTLAWVAVTRMTDKGNVVAPELRISVYDAMKGITINAAKTLSLEKKLGSIKVGKEANFTLLAEDPFKVKPTHLKDIKVLGVVYHGIISMNNILLGGDKDAMGCIRSAGYQWCDKLNRCERPWELAKEKGFKNRARDFDSFCKN